MKEEKRLCVWCEYAKDRTDIAGVYCTGGFRNQDGSCEHFKEYKKRPPRKRRQPASAPELVAARTNADRIRAMSDEELVAVINTPFCDKRTNKECKEVFAANCYACVLDWLQQPAKEEA